MSNVIVEGYVVGRHHRRSNGDASGFLSRDHKNTVKTWGKAELFPTREAAAAAVVNYVVFWGPAICLGEALYLFAVECIPGAPKRFLNRFAQARLL